MRVRPSIAEIDVQKVNYELEYFGNNISLPRWNVKTRMSTKTIHYAYAGAKTAMIIGAKSLET